MYEELSREELIKKIESLELELQEQEVNASRSEAAELLSKMSHELRTPISAIVGFTNILLEEGELNSKEAHYVDMIDTATKIVMHLINDILAFTQIRKKDLELHMRAVNPFVKVFENYKSIKNIALEKSIDLRVAIDPKINEGCFLDDVRMQQVMNNLYTNALKFTPRYGSVHGSIKLLKKSAHSQIIRCSVRDNGIGIEADQIESIFKPFEQANEQISYTYGGTGLGLSISQTILKAMGSELKVISNLGKGSLFYFDLEVELNADAVRLKDVLDGYKIVLLPSISTLFEEVCSYLNSLKIEYELDANILKDANKVRENIVLIFDRDKIEANCPTCEFKKLKKQIIYFTERRGEELPCSDVFIIDEFRECNAILYNVIRGFLKTNKLSMKKSQDKKLSEQFSASVLVAEDYEMNAELIGTILSSFGIESEFAVNGLEVLEKFDENRFDLIFMDINMPNMDGVEVTKRLREEGINTPIIALTANVLYENKKEYIGSGFNGVLTKPIDKCALFEELGKHLVKKELQEQQNSLYQKAANINFSYRYEETIKSLELPVETVYKLIEKFLQTFKMSIMIMKKSLHKKDFETLEVEAHKLRGSSSTLCLYEIQELAADINRDAKSKKFEELTKYILRLEQLHKKLMEEFAQME